MSTRNRLWVCLAALLALSALSVATRARWLAALGQMLVAAEPLEKADAAVIPYSEDFLTTEGASVVEAARLLREGYFSKIFVDEGIPFYGRTACDYWIPFAAQRTGLDEKAFQCVPTHSSSASERPRRVAELVRSQAVSRVLLVTTNEASRRLRRSFREAAPGVEFRPVGTLPRVPMADSWWRPPKLIFS